MPIYEYACKKCGQTIEAIQKMSDPDLKKHQGCGGALTKLFSVPGFHVKEDDGYGGSKHDSVMQQAENERRAKENKKKTPPVRLVPSAAGTRKATRSKVK